MKVHLRRLVKREHRTSAKIFDRWKKSWVEEREREAFLKSRPFIHSIFNAFYQNAAWKSFTFTFLSIRILCAWCCCRCCCRVLFKRSNWNLTLKYLITFPIAIIYLFFLFKNNLFIQNGNHFFEPKSFCAFSVYTCWSGRKCDRLIFEEKSLNLNF